MKLYSTHCPRCKVIEAKLEEKKISYKLEEDIEKMKKKGIQSVPVLEIEGKMLNFTEAIRYINEV